MDGLEPGTAGVVAPDVPDAGGPHPDRPQAEGAEQGGLTSGHARPDDGAGRLGRRRRRGGAGRGLDHAVDGIRRAPGHCIDPQVKSRRPAGRVQSARRTRGSIHGRHQPRGLRDRRPGRSSTRNATSARRSEKAFVWGEGSDKVALFDEKARDREQEELAKAQEWRATQVRRRLRLDHRAGRSTAAASCPAPTSGCGPRSRASTTCPTSASSASGSGMVAPTILAHATDAAKDRYLRAPVPRRPRRPASSSREPGAGSDLASLQTKAERDGDEWLHHRPEGVDVGRAVLRHRRDHLPHRPGPAQAQGPDRVHRRHAGARGRDPAAAPDDRRRQLQRGVLQRGAGARRPPPRRRQPGLVGGAHHADERAGVDRRRRRRAAARAA